MHAEGWSGAIAEPEAYPTTRRLSGDSAREEQNRPSDMDFVQARKVFRGDGCKNPNSAECQQNAEDPAGETENDAFH